MRLIKLINESLHDVLRQLKQDAELLEDGMATDIGVIELVPGWEEEVARLVHRFLPDLKKAKNMNEQLKATHDFLLQHRLAKKIG